MWASFRVLTLCPLSVKSMQPYFDPVPPTSLCSAPGISAPPFGDAGCSAPCNNFETTASRPPDWPQASPAANGNGCSSTRRHASSSRCAGKPLPEFQENEPDPDHLQRCFHADIPDTSHGKWPPQTPPVLSEPSAPSTRHRLKCKKKGLTLFAFR